MQNGKIEFKVNTDIIPNKYKDANQLVYMHHALKKTRNKYNHCDPDRAGRRYIEQFIGEYITLARELISHDEYYIIDRG